MMRSGPVHGCMLYNPAMSRHFAAAALVFALLSPPLLAAPGDAGAPAGSHATVRADGMTLDEAVARAERKYSARAVRAEEKVQDGRRVYRIRLLSEDGRVFDVTVDAATGKDD